MSKRLNLSSYWKSPPGKSPATISLWNFLTLPSRVYRGVEWWIISKLLHSPPVSRKRVSFLLHEKNKDQPDLQLLYYFRDLAIMTKPEDQVKVDMGEVKRMMQAGADAHACDDLGQNIMHEIARYHQAETCDFFLKCQVDINLADNYSVTPLHVAAAFNNSPVVEILASNGGLLEFVTFYMLQTPLHYAARYDSPSSVKKLADMGCELEARDYRGRTPLLLAAELGRVNAGAMLLECGAKVNAIDFTGMYGISAMVNKCPPLALKALDTCLETDLRNRKQYYSLQFLEPATLCNDECAQTTLTVMEEIVKAGSDNLEIVKHKMIQKMIDVKWKQFGKRGFIQELSAYIIVLINWSLLCLFDPIQDPSKGFGEEDDGGILFVERANEFLTVLFYFYQVFDEFKEMRTNTRRHQKFVEQRLEQLEMEFKYLELLSEEEKEYLRKERETVKKSKSTYAEDRWNTFDWFSLVLMFVTLCVHFPIKYYQPWQMYKVYKGILISVTLVIVWLKMFKYCRVLETLGPFCVIIASLPMDFYKIATVYVILYAPMVCLFYHFFSGPYEYEIERDQWDKDPDFVNFDKDLYGTFEQTCFTVFVYTLVGDYGYETLKFITLKRLYPDFLPFTKTCIAYWILVSAVLLLNIFIALMSETFESVYENALVVSRFERAAMIVSIENKLSSYWRKHHLIDILYNYAPAAAFYDDDDVQEDDFFEDEVNEADHELKFLVTKAKWDKKHDLRTFLTKKLQSQSILIAELLEQIEKEKGEEERLNGEKNGGLDKEQKEGIIGEEKEDLIEEKMDGLIKEEMEGMNEEKKEGLIENMDAFTEEEKEDVIDQEKEGLIKKENEV